MKIAETIYTLFLNLHYWPVQRVFCNFQNFFPEENSWNQLNNWKISGHGLLDIFISEISENLLFKSDAQ